MDDRFLNPRNQTLEFANRSRKNLEFVEDAYAAGEDVHPVTQLTLSMLGLVVFPWGERHHIEFQAKSKDFCAMENEGWPTWKIICDYKDKPTVNLSDLIRHLRNAVAHGRIKFSSNSGKIEDVTIVVEDEYRRPEKYNKCTNYNYWCAEIEGIKLREFCMKFFKFITDTTG